MNIKNMKKRAHRKPKVSIGDSGRGQYVFECMGEGVCPECGEDVLVASKPAEDCTVEFRVLCPRCKWESFFCFPESEVPV